MLVLSSVLTKAAAHHWMIRQHSLLLVAACAPEAIGCSVCADPASTPLSTQPQDYVERVQEMHEHGGCGSIG